MTAKIIELPKPKVRRVLADFGDAVFFEEDSIIDHSQWMRLRGIPDTQHSRILLEKGIKIAKKKRK